MPLNSEDGGIPVRSVASAPGDPFARIALSVPDVNVTSSFYCEVLGVCVCVCVCVFVYRMRVCMRARVLVRTHPRAVVLSGLAYARFGLDISARAKPQTLNRKLLTLHRTRYALRPTPYTLHPTPYTLHPTPYTLQPAPRPLDPAP